MTKLETTSITKNHLQNQRPSVGILDFRLRILWSPVSKSGFPSSEWSFVFVKYISLTREISSMITFELVGIKPHYKPYHHTTTDCFQHFISSLPQWEQLLLTHHSFPNNSRTIVASLTNQPIPINTNGSKKSGKGSYGWVLTDPSGTILTKVWGTTYGHCISSFCCEAYGILAATRFILCLRQFYHLPSNNNTITGWCDCKSLIQ